MPGKEKNGNPQIWCDSCAETSLADETDEINQSVPADYFLALSESNSGANGMFVCRDCLNPNLDFMLDLQLGSVDIQSMKYEPEITKTVIWENPALAPPQQSEA